MVFNWVANGCLRVSGATHWGKNIFRRYFLQELKLNKFQIKELYIYYFKLINANQYCVLFPRENAQPA